LTLLRLLAKTQSPEKRLFWLWRLRRIPNGYGMCRLAAGLRLRTLLGRRLRLLRLRTLLGRRLRLLRLRTLLRMWRLLRRWRGRLLGHRWRSTRRPTRSPAGCLLRANRHPG
jgi:hypothetical protein